MSFTPLRVLITNIRLDGRSGTEIVVRNLARGLKAAGHLPMVYSPRLGAVAEGLRAEGIPVFSRIEQIRTEPDIIHGHHVIQTGVAVIRFPQVPALFVCHDFVAWHDEPPHLENLVRFVAVGDATRDRLTIGCGIDPARVSVIENATDMQLFLPGPPPAMPARRALVMLKGAGQMDPIMAACRQRGIELQVAGSFIGQLHEHPEQLFPSQDLVFASGLTAIEAMACLRPLILCDHRGLAGFVTPARFDAWKAQNFGLRALSRPLNEETVLEEIDRVQAEAATAVGLRVRQECALEPWVDRYLEMYRRCIDEGRAGPRLASAAAMARHIEQWSSATAAATERERNLQEFSQTMALTGLTPLTPGVRTATNDTRLLSLSGFHQAEPWGCWSARSPALITALRPTSDQPQWLRVDYVPYLSAAIRTRHTLCSINGRQAANWTDEGDQPDGIRTRYLPVGNALNNTGALFLTIETSHARSPKEDGRGEDPRHLGLGIVAVTLIHADQLPSEAATAVEPTDPNSGGDLCTVVLSHKAPATLVDAVRSLLAQQDARDILVVNSGGGGAAAALKQAGIPVRVIEHDARLYPGGARNMGVAATTHRYVAFLACDCLASPGWVSERLAAHKEGHAAVASALLCHRPRHPVALAAHLTLFCRRMPRVAPVLAQCYGASYERRLFEEHGCFRDDIEGGEDTDFHRRLPDDQRPVWRPGVRTIHRGPSSLTGFLVDQYRRGRRASNAWRAIAGRSRSSFAWGILGRIGLTIHVSLRVCEPRSRLSTWAALPLIAVGGLVYAAGAVSTPHTATASST
ncbi:glycosyltransferase [Hydrogenophaga pseudoflava]|uniref:glycosyltransferase n=1 Tax=Hydrogenophaga pseudoflava TaxID=47421 RepID=UPI0027E55B98|nr:glycosyltransferase [Hydrogenophaga pseudoflava]MDQ7744203.1 glycosyltransferase [Hydrogenophaga pseudoflava]